MSIPAIKTLLHGRWNSESLTWRHNEHDGVSNHRHPDCLLTRLFRPILSNGHWYYLAMNFDNAAERTSKRSEQITWRSILYWNPSLKLLITFCSPSRSLYRANAVCCAPKTHIFSVHICPFGLWTRRNILSLLVLLCRHASYECHIQVYQDRINCTGRFLSELTPLFW